MNWIRLEVPESGEVHLIDLGEIESAVKLSTGQIRLWYKSGRTVEYTKAKGSKSDWPEVFWSILMQHGKTESSPTMTPVRSGMKPLGTS